MNTHQLPNLETLRQLVGKCDDLAGPHILWIDQSGKVDIALLAPGETPNSWFKANQRRVATRLECFSRGNGYVGPMAAIDEAYMRELLSRLHEAWEETQD